MGRILEILSRPTTRSLPPASDRLHPSSRIPAESTPETRTEAEIPYIEVGGPSREVDASPSVKAAASDVATIHAKKGRTIPLPGIDGSSPSSIAYRSHANEPTIGPATGRFVPQLIAFHQPHHAVSDQYRAVLGKMVTQQLGTAAPVLLMVAPVSGIGTTTAVLNLAITRAAHSQCRVLVVDGNLRRPAIAKQLGLGSDLGLREVIARSVPLGRAVQDTGQAGLWALTAGTSESADRPWPTTEAFRSVLQALREHFDWIIVDGPAWDGGPEMISWAGACDVVYLVVRPDMIETPIVDDLARLIPPIGSQLGGYILSQR